MTSPVPVLDALAQVAVKRRFFTRTTATRLLQGASAAGVADSAGLRTWLARAEVVHPELGKKLTALLPPGEGIPFGPYRALAHLADGGMGSVWLAARPGVDGLVVIKTIKAGFSGPAADDALRRFEREARITRQLAHGNVVRCVDSGVADDGNEGKALYLVLEYVDSGDLRDLVEATGGLSEPLALAILHQIADGLAEAHRLHLVHRDIKPGNIFVASSGAAKLADFGIARSTANDRTMLTMEGSIVGSPQYMSPEQIQSPGEVDIRSDVYALGAVLYFCLAEQPPYGGRLQEILHHHIAEPIPDVREKRPGISAGTQAIIARCMAKRREDRFQDPAQLRDAVAATLAALGLGHRPDATPGMIRDAAAKMAESGPEHEVNPDLPTVASPDQLGATITADLSGGGGGSGELATMAADLSGGEAPPPDPAAPPAPGFEFPTIETAGDRIRKAGSNPGTPVSMPGAIPPGAPPAPAPPAAAGPDGSPTILAQQIAPTVITSDRAPPPARAEDELVTMTANLIAVALQASPHVPKDPPALLGPVAGAAGPLAQEITTPQLTGDPATALALPAIALVGPGGPGLEPVVLLFAKPRVSFGKLREAAVDLCLRNYPIAEYKDACTRISRTHGHLAFDAASGTCRVEDAQAANGTRLDGLTIPPGGHAALGDDGESVLEVAGVVVLRLRPLVRRGPVVTCPPALVPHDLGLETGLPFDALTLTRPENRPDLAAALVFRRLTIGGPGADLALAGARTRAAVEVAVLGGRWFHRPLIPGTPAGPLAPLTEGQTLTCGGIPFVVRPASHELYA